CASIAEMAEYMRFHLDPVAGRGGLRLSPAAAAELTTPQVYIDRSEFTEVGDRHYGLGFNVVHYRGARRVGHGGGWAGYKCDLRLLPDHGSGWPRSWLRSVDQHGPGPSLGAGPAALARPVAWHPASVPRRAIQASGGAGSSAPSGYAPEPCACRLRP